MENKDCSFIRHKALKVNLFLLTLSDHHLLFFLYPSAYLPTAVNHKASAALASGFLTFNIRQITKLNIRNIDDVGLMSEFFIYNTSELHLFPKGSDKNVQALKNTKNKHTQSNLIGYGVHFTWIQLCLEILVLVNVRVFGGVGDTKYTRQARNIDHVMT